MSDELLETLDAIERQGWDSLCDGTASDFYGKVMTSDGFMVLANGAALTRDQVVSALRDAPTWSGYQMSDIRLVTTGGDSAALVYKGTAERDGEDAFVGTMSSVYVRINGTWRLALYTQTPRP
jgi:Domain of unknown function (DUF4440)